MWRHVSELKNNELGKDIYVLGSGKSLDYVEPSFFNGKITIGIGDVYKRFRCNYSVTKERQHLARRVKEANSTFIVAEFQNGNNHTSRNPDIPIEGLHYYFNHRHNDHRLHLEELDSDRIIVSWGTVNTALHLACYLGAQNIILAGCDCGTIDGQSNFDNYRDANSAAPPSSKQWYDNWLKKIAGDIVILANELRRRGLGVVSLNPFVNFQLEGHVYK